MWIRTISNMDNEIMINLDNIEGIAYDSNANQTILTSPINKYTIKGTPDRIFELLEQKGMVEVLPLPREEEDEDSISDKEWADWAETMFAQEYLSKQEN